MVSSLSLAIRKLYTPQDSFLSQMTRHVRDLLWAENLTTFSNYMRLHAKRLRGGPFTCRIFLLKPCKTRHMFVFYIPTCLWRPLCERQPNNEGCGTDTFCPKPDSLILWLQGSSLHDAYPGLSLSLLFDISPGKCRGNNQLVTAHLQVLPRGDFFSLIKIHYHEDGRVSH